MRRLVVTVLSMLCFLGMASGAGAQAHPTSCAEFTDQASAQTYFDAQGADYEKLDTDDNGIACDEPGAFGGGGPSAGPDDGTSAHPTECAEFLDQAAAQTYFDAKGLDYENLDAYGNGIACDESNAPEPSSSTDDDDDAGVSGLPVTGSDPTNESGLMTPALAGVTILLLAGAAIATRRLVIGTA